MKDIFKIVLASIICVSISTQAFAVTDLNINSDTLPIKNTSDETVETEDHSIVNDNIDNGNTLDQEVKNESTDLESSSVADNKAKDDLVSTETNTEKKNVQNNISDEENQENIKTVINQYFNFYSDILSGNDNDSYALTCIDNADTQLYKTMMEYQSDAYKIVDTEISNMQYDLDYKNINISGNDATVEVVVNLTMNYMNIPGDGKTVNNYSFSLMNVDGLWKISSIKSDTPAFKTFQSYGRSTRSILSTSFNEIKHDLLKNIEANKIAEESVVNREKNADELQKVDDDKLNMAITRATSSSYSASKGVSYAKAHYKDNSNYFMDYDYGGNGNCQNFASQCVWAGYGGASNLRTNIKNRVKMTSEWYCGPDGGSSAWINVNSFKSYVSKSKSTGPVGHVYNNQRVYTDFGATGIKSGEVLQLKNGSGGGDNYSHSIYVLSNTASSDSDYNRIKIASNTGTYCNVPLKSYMIDYFGGSNCYMRDIAFSRAKF